MKKRKQKSVAGRPFKEGVKRVRMSFTLHPERFHWLKNQARLFKISLSEYLDQIIHESQKHEKIKEFCQTNSIKKFALFGSVLRKDFNSASDVDVLVEFFPGHEPGYFKLGALALELSKIFDNRKVDLRTMDELSRYFRDKVSREARTLYAA